MFLAKVQALASFCSDFPPSRPFTNLERSGLLCCCRSCERTGRRFGSASAPPPSLDPAPIAEGTIRCLLILSHVAGSSAVARRQTKRLRVFRFGCLQLCFPAMLSSHRFPESHLDKQYPSNVRGQPVGGGRPVRRGRRRARLESRMRSRSGKKLRRSRSRGRGGGIPGARRGTRTGGKRLLPAATHQHITQVTSYTPHFVWNAAARRAEWYR